MTVDDSYTLLTTLSINYLICKFRFPDKKVHREVEQSVLSSRHHHLAVSWVQLHQDTLILIRPISALNLPVTPVLHVDTGPVLTRELVVIAGGEGHVPHVLRAAGIPDEMPSVSPQEEGACRRPAVGIELRVSRAPSFPQGAHGVKPRGTSR